MPTLHRGHLVHLTGRPDVRQAADALVEHADGALMVDDEGVITWSGAYADRPATGDDLELVDHGDAFLLPGFVDTHLHFPQVYSTHAYGGGQLLEWLDECIFPAEARLADDAFAAAAAADFCHRLASVGTTTSLVFGSAFPGAQARLFEEYARIGLRGVIGRGIQTTGPASARPLLTGESEAIRLTEAEIERWHPATSEEAAQALVAVAVVPRFALSVTPTTLGALGELYDHYRGRGVYFTSHLSENDRAGDGEIAKVLDVFGVESYLDTYDGRYLPGGNRGGASLLGRRSVLAHCVHCSDGELGRMAEVGASVAHCPTSQLFLGNGTMPWRRTVASGVTVAVGTDIGAGDSWLIPSVLNSAFKVHLGEPGPAGVTLHPAELLHLATVAGARALDLEERIGNFDPGRDADLVVIDPSRHPPFARDLERGVTAAASPEASGRRLFKLLMACTEETVAATYVRGRLLPNDGRTRLERKPETEA